MFALAPWPHPLLLPVIDFFNVTFYIARIPSQTTLKLGFEISGDLSKLATSYPCQVSILQTRAS